MYEAIEIKNNGIMHDIYYDKKHPPHEALALFIHDAGHDVRRYHRLRGRLRGAGHRVGQRGGHLWRKNSMIAKKM